MATPIEISWANFSGGQNTEKPATKLAGAHVSAIYPGTNAEQGAPASEFVSLAGVFVSVDGARLFLRGGEHTIITALSAGIVVAGFTRAIVGNSQYIVYADFDNSSPTYHTHVYSYPDPGGPATSIYSAGGSGPLAAPLNYEFAKYSAFGVDRVFFANGIDTLQSWNGTGGASAVGIAAPITAPTSGQTNIGTGKLNADGLPAYGWYITYGTSDGVESNPSPGSALQGGTSPFDGTLASIPVSPNARVDRRFIYRVGGNLASPVRVGQILDNTTTTYTDALPDISVGTIALNFDHGLLPNGIEHVTVNKSRLICSKGYTVYVSSAGKPDDFPTTYSDPLTDGVQFAVDPDPTNPIIALGTTGSATLIARRKNIYLLQGQTADQMTINKIADIGCVASRSLKMCRTSAVWMAPDATIWILGDGEPQRLGAPIERQLRAITASWLPNACAAYHDDRYVICIPGPGANDIPFVFVYDFRTGCWSELSAACMAATQLYADTGLGDLNELLIATAPGYRTLAGATYSGIKSELSLLDVADVPLTVTSGKAQPFGSAWNARIESVRVRGKLTPKAATDVILTLHAGTNTASYVLTPGASDSSVLIEQNVLATLEGRDLWWSISGQASVFELEEVSLGVARLDRVIN